jgi:hypothetical protein
MKSPASATNPQTKENVMLNTESGLISCAAANINGGSSAKRKTKTKKEAVTDPVIMLHKTWKQIDEEIEKALARGDEIFSRLPENARVELLDMNDCSEEEKARVKAIQDMAGYTQEFAKRDALYKEYDSLEQRFLSTMACTPEGALLQAQEILKAAEDYAFDTDEYANAFMRNTISLSGKVSYGSTKWERLEEAKELLREAKAVDRVRKTKYDIFRAINGPLPSEATLSSYIPLTEHEGMPITYIGDHKLVDGEGIHGLSKKWRLQEVKYGNLPLTCVEIWDGHKRWFDFDDKAIREYYESSGTKPTCNYVYLSDYPPHPGEDRGHYFERMTSWHGTFGPYMDLLSQEREGKEDSKTS